MRRKVICAWLAVAFLSGGLMGKAVAAPQTARPKYQLWGGQAAIALPSSVKISRGKKYSDRYEAVLRESRDGREVVFQRGRIPRKYSRVSTGRIGAIARDRLKKKGFEIHEFRVSGRIVSIRFGGLQTVSVDTPRGTTKIEVPWQARLRWIRQTDHQTYQSSLKMTSAEWESGTYGELARVAASLRVPLKRVSLRERIKDTAAAVPVAGQKIGSWFPGWNF